MVMLVFLRVAGMKIREVIQTVRKLRLEICSVSHSDRQSPFSLGPSNYRDVLNNINYTLMASGSVLRLVFRVYPPCIARRSCSHTAAHYYFKGALTPSSQP